MKENNKKIITAFKAEDLEEVKKFLKEFPEKTYKKNPYLRHLEVLIDYGKPPGQYHTIQLKKDGQNYLIGTIVFSHGERIIFFPGIQNLLVPSPITKKSYNIHHLTCEKSLKEGHLKFRDRNIRFPDFMLQKVNNLYFWFGLAIDKPTVLFSRTKHKELVKIPKKIGSDVQRRLSWINQYCQKGFGFDIKSRTINSQEFLNFEFFIKKDGKSDLSEILNIPIGSYNADFKDGRQYPTTISHAKDNKSNQMVIIRFSILSKNKENSLSLRKSSIFFYYLKPFNKY